MKKPILILVLMLFGLQVVQAQVMNPVAPSHSSYLKKSKSQKTIGWVMLGGGVGLMVTGIGVGINNLFSGDDSGGLIFALGGAAALGSIPFFIAGAKNGKRARALVKTETLRMGDKVLAKSQYPALALRIPLGKR